MSIYDVNATNLTHAYSPNGDALSAAYSADGALVFSNFSAPLRVCNYNVGGWYIGSGSNVPTSKYNDYLDMQDEVFANVDADILCLEEYWTYFSGEVRAAEVLLSKYYPYTHSVNGTNAYFGRCICSKYPIVSYVQKQFTDDGNRYYDVATIDVNGLQIKVFVVHLNNSSNTQVRVDEAETIRNYIASQGFNRYIICGDFNVNVHDPLSEYDLEVFGGFIEDGCELANGGSFGVLESYSRNSAYTDNLAVDNIIVSDSFTLLSASVDFTKVEFQAVNGEKIDHIPLIAELQIN